MSYIREELRVAGWINFLIGVWLMLAPFALGFAHLPAAMWNSIVVGGLMMLVALVRMVKPRKTAPLHWVNAILGLWLVVSPFFLGFAFLIEAAAAHIVVGLFAILLAGGSAISMREETETGTRS